jgi:hypothetical protein
MVKSGTGGSVKKDYIGDYEVAWKYLEKSKE